LTCRWISVGFLDIFRALEDGTNLHLLLMFEGPPFLVFAVCPFSAFYSSKIFVKGFSNNRTGFTNAGVGTNVK